MTKKKLIIIISIIITLAILVGVGVFALSGNKTTKIADKLDLGEKYLEELEYEKALAYFMEVLEIDPKNVDAYLGIADVYVAMGEHQKALEILDVGYQETENEKMVEKFEEVEALMSSEADSVPEEDDFVIEGEKLPSSLYFVCIDGIQFNLPFQLSELEKVGFDLTECKGTMLESGGETHYWLKKKDVSYIFYVYNQNETESSVMDAMVYSMGLSVDDCAKVKFRTIGDIEYGSDMEFVNSVSLKYEGDSIEVDDGRTIFNFAENNELRQFYRIDVGPEGFAQYFEVYNRDASCLYGVDRVGRFLEYSPEAEAEIPEEILQLIENGKDEKFFMFVDGVKYTVPFKVSELEKAGFDLSEHKEEMLEPGGNTHYWLLKNNIQYSFHIINQNDITSSVMDCMVHHAGLDVVCYPKAGAIFHGGMRYGTDEETVKAICETYGGNIHDPGDGRTIYNIWSGLGQSYRVDISPEGIATYFEFYSNNFEEVNTIEIVE